jgi:SPP1 gp7 family putative phage head morphogenesis protein
MKELLDVKDGSSFVTLSPIDKRFRRLLRKSMMLAYLMGAQSMKTEIENQRKDFHEIQYFDDTQFGFDEAVKELKRKKIIGAHQFRIAEANIKATAFSVQKIERFNMLSDIKSSLIDAIDDGLSFGQWKNERMAQVFKAHGTTPLDPHHLETIFRTNLNSVYNLGRDQVALRSPYVEGFEYAGVDDKRQTAICKSLDGTQLPKNDPRWSVITPPNHYNCRSMKIAITFGYREANNVKWDKSVNTDVVQEDFKDSPRSLSQYKSKINGVLKKAEEKSKEKSIELKSKQKKK